ncbi:MAG TPA: PDZ domain-containing protein [Burkholderiaceae bacterium]|nr:PDZ domain-containing protein [Burkholderiaceae bacterium]
MTEEILLYQVTPHDPAGHRLKITLDISRPAPGGQAFYLPAWIPGSYLIRDFARQIETLQATSHGQPVTVQKTGNCTWQAEPVEGPLRLEYTVYAWDLSVRSAHIDESHAFFNGTSVFLAPEGQTHLPCVVELCPPPHTSDWTVHTSLPRAEEATHAAIEYGFGRYRAPDYDALIDHPIEMGTPQTIHFDAHGARHEMVFTGVAPNLDLERIAADTKKICEAQIALFDPDTLNAPFLDSSDRYVFMTMVTGNDYGGLEHRASTALMIARRHLPVKGQPIPEGYADFLGLISHEYFHTWHVKRIKPQAFAPYDLTTENHTRLLWVFEGFTSFYDDAMLPRAGVIAESEYLDRLARVITNVHRGPGRLKQSVAESSFDTWTRFYKQDENSPNALVSYYTKGSLVALGLDLLIRTQTDGNRSLDDVMRLLWQRYGRDFYQRTGASQVGVAEAAMPALIQEATGVDVDDFISRYAYGCEDVPLQALFADQGITLSWETDKDDNRLDVRLKNADGGCAIATAYEGGVAHAAGLSAGDHIVAVGGLRVRTDQDIVQTLGYWQPGQTVTIHVFRRDELRHFEVTLREPEAIRCRLARENKTPHAS